MADVVGQNGARSACTKRLNAISLKKRQNNSVIYRLKKNFPRTRALSTNNSSPSFSKEGFEKFLLEMQEKICKEVRC